MPGLSSIRIAFLLFPDVTQLDLTGPAQVLSRLGNATIDLVARDVAPVATDAGFALLPTATFADAPPPDILCIPGGFGVNDAMEDPATLAWVGRAAAGATWVTSVCTGALLLGAAGLLRGYRATTHWASHHHLAAFGAIPVRERVVFDRNRVTGGGVTAGIDFGLALTAAIRGEAHARLVQLGLEYDPHPPFDSGSPEHADDATIARYQALAAKSAPGRESRTRAAAERMMSGGDGVAAPPRA
ncbi:DJ-1/PfpI family protein [Sphingomonas sp. QA11]|uniref:DJ-1/PfpI family protein n=1 Tax=Sphingomonas sp. QA11 TaxID=2950605 RepID=UPI00234B453F|nr:DJ-1/PfpI family protein [Sphingomonas sp. QA11]WCM26845.1 DJ-1/PfpI family protein [Sphingomonas sp. QA11]